MKTAWGCLSVTLKTEYNDTQLTAFVLLCLLNKQLQFLAKALSDLGRANSVSHTQPGGTIKTMISHLRVL